MARWVETTGLALVLALGWAVAGIAAPDTQQAAGRITVTGQGHVAAAPDLATITLGVTTKAAEAAAAMAANSAQQSKVMAALKAAGVAPRDIQNSGLSLSPHWSRPAKADEAALLVGFVATNTVTVRVRALDRLGQVLDGLVKAGVNTMHGLSFGLSAPGPMEDVARKAAVADAQRKAALYAKAAGVSLGSVLSIEEDGGRGLRPVMRLAAAPMADAVPMAAGEMSVDASVTVVFAITQ